MITRELPFPGLDPGQTVSAVCFHKYTPMKYVKETLSSKLQNFLSAVFEKDPDRRPSARELLTFDPFIKGGVFKPLADCESESPTGQLVQSFSKLTVKLYVKKTSRDRPSSAPDKENSGRKRRRKTENSKRLGTGLVTAVYETIEGRRAFKIATDSSIIYDQIEAENSECTLYYDSVKNKGIFFKKGNFLHRHSERNVTEVEFIVRNEKILLEEEIETFRRCLKESSVQKKSVVMVSHPLGYPKHVSVGIIDDSVDVGLHDDGILRYPGITGAPIFKHEDQGHCQSDKLDAELLTYSGICLASNFESLKIVWNEE